ncbi:MAG: hypothetical protein HY074_12390 [Deltaproteobacteria bacterium]|nr:hypothetical protein [Deltaproteobacteria bacterium]
MRLRVCWIGFLLLISGLAFGLVQIDRQARATLVGVNASFSNVDQAYRRLLWDVRYIASTRTEDDLHKFSTTGIAEILNLADINRLHRLQPWLVSPALRHEVKITLDDLQYYLGLAGLKTANSWFEPREVENAHQAERLAAQLESVLSEQLHRFQYTGDGCQLGYTDVKNDIGKIENHQSPKASLKCLVQASKSLLDQLKEPLFEYRKVTNRKHSADLWSPKNPISRSTI